MQKADTQFVVFNITDEAGQKGYGAALIELRPEQGFFHRIKEFIVSHPRQI